MVTAVTDTTPERESQPSFENEGWLHYCQNGGGVLDPCLHRRDPDGNGVSLVCGDENASLLPARPIELEASDDPLRVAQAPYRTIGQIYCEDCGSGDPGANPYAPPSRWVFYHLDHLGSPRPLCQHA
ncbi:MAG: hypothetical protein ACREIH_04205 [Nitrospiraceae bacterium]